MALSALVLIGVIVSNASAEVVNVGDINVELLYGDTDYTEFTVTTRSYPFSPNIKFSLTNNDNVTAHNIIITGELRDGTNTLEWRVENNSYGDSSTFELAAGETKSLVYLPAIYPDTPEGIYNGTVLISASETDYASFDVTIKIIESKLRIKGMEVTVDGGLSDKISKSGETIDNEAKPGSVVEFNVDIGNLYTKTQDIGIEEVNVRVYIWNIKDGNKIMEEIEIDSIEADEDNITAPTITLILPTKVEEGVYSGSVDIYGWDEEGIRHSDSWNFGIEIEKDTHKVIISDLYLEEDSLKCEENASLEVLVQNIGRSDEDNVVLTVNNDNLGINSRQTGIALEEFRVNSNNAKIIQKIKDVVPSDDEIEEIMILEDIGDYRFRYYNIVEGDGDEEEGDYFILVVYVNKLNSERYDVNYIKDSLQKFYFFLVGDIIQHGGEVIRYNGQNLLTFVEHGSRSYVWKIENDAFMLLGGQDINTPTELLDAYLEKHPSILEDQDELEELVERFEKISEIDDTMDLLTVPIIVPANMEPGEYPLTAKVYYNTNILSDIKEISLTVKPCKDISLVVEPVTMKYTPKYGDTISGSFTVTNNGILDLESITINETLPQFQLAFKPAAFGLPSQEKQTVTFSAVIQNATNPGLYTGDITIANANVTLLIPLTVDLRAENKLKIKEVKATVGGSSDTVSANGNKISKKAKPGDKVKLKVEVENSFTSTEGKDMEVEFTVTAKDIDDNDDITEDSDSFDVRAGTDDSETVEFTVPVDVQSGIFDIVIEVTGDDDSGREHSDSWSIKLNVEREKHSVQVTGNTALSSEEINCNRDTALHVEVQNIGEKDEEDVVVDVRSQALGINIKKSDIPELVGDDVSDDDSKYNFDIPVHVSDSLSTGSYEILVEAFYDTTRTSDTRQLTLIVEECDESKIGRQSSSVSTLTQGATSFQQPQTGFTGSALPYQTSSTQTKTSFDALSTAEVAFISAATIGAVVIIGSMIFLIMRFR